MLSFSPTCTLQTPGDYTCDQCQLGYAGHKCERYKFHSPPLIIIHHTFYRHTKPSRLLRCANGYYGDPTVLGQRCSVCECNGNVDSSEPGHCDGLTGECLKCLSHSSGRHCERCQDGFYGDAVTEKNCQREFNTHSVFDSYYETVVSFRKHDMPHGSMWFYLLLF